MTNLDKYGSEGGKSGYGYGMAFFGGPGHDRLIGGYGADLMDGGPGDDRLYGDYGDD